jgi:CRISPR-associated protein Csd2
MSNPIYLDPEKRHDFVYLFDVADGNPNGDPDAGNLPRVDPETMHGLVTDVCVKRKIRNWVDITRGSQRGYRIYVQNKGIALNDLHREAHVARFGENGGKEQAKGEVKRQQEQDRRAWMSEHFYDIRTFGAVMTTGDYPAAQVRGPIQLTFARSVDPIVPLDLSITRVAITQSGTDKVTEMGRKALVPYALYVGRGFFTPHFARQSGFSGDDFALFWEALQKGWDLDRSASRGMMALRGLYIFSHENPLGNAAAHTLMERVSVNRASGVKAPRRFADYSVHVDDATLPAGVTLTRLVD